MAGLIQSSTCRRPSYFSGFCSSRTLRRDKKFEHLNLCPVNLRSDANLEAQKRANATTIDSVSTDGDKSSSSLPFMSSEKFENPKWKNGTWDIQQFTKDGKVDWDAVIDSDKEHNYLHNRCLEANNGYMLRTHDSVHVRFCLLYTNIYRPRHEESTSKYTC